MTLMAKCRQYIAIMSAIFRPNGDLLPPKCLMSDGAPQASSEDSLAGRVRETVSPNFARLTFAGEAPRAAEVEVKVALEVERARLGVGPVGGDS